MKLIIAVFAVALCGCQACRTHPIACAAIGAVVVGSVAATLAHNPGGIAVQSPTRGCGVIGTAEHKKPACP